MWRQCKPRTRHACVERSFRPSRGAKRRGTVAKTPGATVSATGGRLVCGREVRPLGAAAAMIGFLRAFHYSLLGLPSAPAWLPALLVRAPPLPGAALLCLLRPLGSICLAGTPACAPFSLSAASVHRQRLWRLAYLPSISFLSSRWQIKERAFRLLSPGFSRRPVPSGGMWCHVVTRLLVCSRSRRCRRCQRARHRLSGEVKRSDSRALRGLRAKGTRILIFISHLTLRLRSGHCQIRTQSRSLL